MRIIKLIETVWIALGVLWFVGALLAKPTARRESAQSRLAHLVLIVGAFTCIYGGPRSGGVLGWRWVPDSPWTNYVGLTLTLAGAAFAIWARLYLGRNWSGTVTIKENHRLIRSGPYALVRHPIYSGLLLALLGTALALGEIRGLVALVLACAGCRMKSKIEEQSMSEEFGTEYAEYERQVKAFIPFVV